MKYAAGRDVSLAGVAFLFGYANPPAFTLVFGRWTGKAPSELRQSKAFGGKDYYNRAENRRAAIVNLVSR